MFFQISILMTFLGIYVAAIIFGTFYITGCFDFIAFYKSLTGIETKKHVETATEPQTQPEPSAPSPPTEPTVSTPVETAPVVETFNNTTSIGTYATLLY